MSAADVAAALQRVATRAGVMSPVSRRRPGPRYCIRQPSAAAPPLARHRCAKAAAARTSRFPNAEGAATFTHEFDANAPDH